MQGQTFRLWAACQEGPGLECKSTYCSCRYAGVTAPVPHQLSYAIAWYYTAQDAHLIPLYICSVCVCVCISAVCQFVYVHV